jgi:large subunit ribosomal protein LP1
MSNIAELAVPYAILALHDDNVEITEENVMKLLTAANIEVEAVWVSIFVKAFEGKNIGDMLTSFSSAPVAAGVAASSAAAAPAAAAKEEAKKEVKEESDDDMGFGLFD